MSRKDIHRDLRTASTWHAGATGRANTVSWSSDSRCIAYANETDNQHSGIYVFDTKEKKAYQVTSGYYSDTGNTFIYPNFTRIAMVTLQDTLASPLSPKNDTTSGEGIR